MSAWMLLPAAASADRRVYQSLLDGNAVAGFNIGTDGALSPLPGSPYATGVGPRGIAFTPDGRFAFNANFDGDSVSGHSVSGTGALAPVPGTPFPGGNGPRGVAVTPDGRFVYTANELAGNVSGFAIGPDGSLAPVPGAPFAAAVGARGVAITPNGLFAYVTNASSVFVFAVAEDGSLAAVGPPVAGGGLGLAITPDGRFLFVNGGVAGLRAFKINANGLLSSLGTTAHGAGGPDGVAITPDGSGLYLVGETANVAAFDIGPDGSLSPVPGQPFPGSADQPIWAAVTPDGKRMYSSNFNSMQDTLIGFDIAADGALSELPSSPFPAGGHGGFFSLAISPNQGPTASFVSTPAPAGQPTSFDASASTDSDGTPASFVWDFGDGQTGSGLTPSHVYAAAGTYPVTLTVTDNEGCSTELVFTGQNAHCNGSAAARAQSQVTVGEPPPSSNPDTEPPGLTLVTPGNQTISRPIRVRTSCSEACVARGSAKLILRITPEGRRSTDGKSPAKTRRLPFRPVELTIAEGETETLAFRLAKKNRRLAESAMRAGARAKARITVSATDGSGNRSLARRVVTVKGPAGKR